MKSANKLFDKFKYELDNHSISQQSHSSRKTRRTVRREQAWKYLTMESLLQMKFSSMYQPLVPEMTGDMINNSQMVQVEDSRTEACNKTAVLHPISGRLYRPIQMFLNSSVWICGGGQTIFSTEEKESGSRQTSGYCKELLPQ